MINGCHEVGSTNNKYIQFWDSMKSKTKRVTSSKVCSHSSINSHIDGNFMERVIDIILDELTFVLPYGNLFICGVQVITNLFRNLQCSN
jgi:hypothetical protein